MKKLKKQYRRLFKFYKKELCQANKLNYTQLLNPIEYFAIYLRFMRDVYILTDKELDPNKNVKLASICTAVNLIEHYYGCINDFYDISTGVPKQRDLTLSAEEVNKLFVQAKVDYWNHFWQCVNTNIEGWFNVDEFNI